MKIRRISRYSDRIYEAALELLPQLNPDLPLPSKDDFRKFLKSESTHFFIAEAEGRKIAGMLTLIKYIIPTGPRFWIEDVVVDQSHRGKGIGRDMMLQVISYAAAIGAKSIDLTSRPFRKAANKLYLDLGFKLRETNAYRYFIK
jgi:ribosomal protein S18 acetylase RimI-like enzyme